MRVGASLCSESDLLEGVASALSLLSGPAHLWTAQPTWQALLALPGALPVKYLELSCQSGEGLPAFQQVLLRSLQGLPSLATLKTAERRRSGKRGARMRPSSQFVLDLMPPALAAQLAASLRDLGCLQDRKAGARGLGATGGAKAQASTAAGGVAEEHEGSEGDSEEEEI